MILTLAMLSPKTKIGILGGGQLGKMLALAAVPLHLDLHFLEKSSDCPAAPFAPHFVAGDFCNYDDVMNFGKALDVITIEIENVNTEALEELERMGKIVHPSPKILALIKDKGLQKQFYIDHSLPTSDFRLFESADQLKAAIAEKKLPLPFVQKSRTDGYDGKGVHVVRSEQDLEKLLPGPCLTEALVDIDKELSVIAARNEAGEVSIYPPVEMVFDHKANLVRYLFAPANISQELSQKVEKLAVDVCDSFGICGLLAVEMFLTKDGEVLLNEVAPRPHNSGHHTIEANLTSQFEQHLRAILNLPLGTTHMLRPAVMVNILGGQYHLDADEYINLEEVLKIEGAFVHLYGKKHTKPFRKLGHVTVTANTIEDAIAKSRQVSALLDGDSI